MHRKLNLKVVIPCVSFVIISVVIIILCLKKPSQVRVTTILTPYNVLSSVNSKDNISVNLYVNYKDSYFTDVNKVVSSSIYGEDTMYTLKLKSIESSNNKTSLYNEDYYLFTFIFDFDYKFLTDYRDEIEKAHLNMNYSNGIETNIYIGSLSIYKYEENYENQENGDIAVTTIKTIDEVKNNNVLVKGLFGCNLGIRNLTNQEINIISIEALDVSIEDYKCFKEVDNANEVCINNIYQGYPSISNDYESIMIDKNSVKFVSVPIVLRKLNDYNIGTFGLKITYEIKENGALLSKKTKDYYLSKFGFYNTNYSVKEENLKYYEYEYK